MRAASPFEPILEAPRTISYCAACGEYTPHLCCEGDGVVAKICVPCAERQLTEMLGRD